MTQVDEHEVWIDALAGRAGSSEDALVAEARALRAALLSRAPAPAPFVRTPDSGRENELIARARREGLLPLEHTAASARPRRRPFARTGLLSGWRGLAAAAVVASVAGASLYLLRPTPPPEIVRGAASGVVRLVSSDPRPRQQKFLAELRAMGVQATGYEMLGRWGVVADLAQPLSPGVREVLRRYDVPLPAGDELHLEFVSESGR